MSTASSRYLRALVTHEAALWSTVDRRLAKAGVLRLGRLSFLRLATELTNPRVQDVADKLGIDVGAASRLTDRLAGDGLVMRRPHPTDGRSSVIDVTEHGADALAASVVVLDEALRDVLKDVDPATLARATDALELIHAAVRDDTPEPRR